MEEQQEDARTFRVICRELLERGTTTKELSRHHQLKAEYRYYISLIRRDLKKEGDTREVKVVRLEPTIRPSGQKVYNNYSYKIEEKVGQSELALSPSGGKI